MKHVASTHRWRDMVGAASCLFGLTLSAGALAAQTDISSSPIISTTAAQVKPNIMLLMDASDSMARTHMPDEVEANGAGVKFIGYKNWQCNSLYYNPAQTYVLPKKADGTFFPIPDFTKAPYAGFGDFYTPKETRTVDLSSSFQAYDVNTLELPIYTDTAQPAYYYLYTGNKSLNFANAPCTDKDTGVTKPASDNSGTWKRVLVTATSGPGATDETQNFAIWYAFYRTRLSMMKSAASLAFTPLTDSFRVGFITVQPKKNPGDQTIELARYLPIKDFDSTQRTDWFTKLFSQVADGSSPTREGLARVGRHYGGKQDSINAGMTGDPVQYSCQQNFTILTTDGYWNGQTETPTGNGLYGGPLKLDGVTRVGQQDGDPDCPVTDTAFCARPIFDGGAAATKVSTDKVNIYPVTACGATSWFQSTAQTTATTFSKLKDSEKTEETKTEYLETKERWFAQTTSTTKTVDKITQTTEQYLKTIKQTTEQKYQIRRVEEQTERLSEQYRLTTSQTFAQTSRTDKVVTQFDMREEQWTAATSKNVLTTTQYVQTQSQYKQKTENVIKEEYVEVRSPIVNENWKPVQGACVPDQHFKCKKTTTYGPQAVYPEDCTPDSVGSGANYTKTTCTNGPATAAEQPVSSCTPGVQKNPATFVVTTCTLTTQPSTAINGTCVVGSTVGANYVITTCSRPAAYNTTTNVSSCPSSPPPYQAPDWINTTCAVSNTAATPAPACTPGTTTDSNNVTTTCAKALDQTTRVASCTPNAGTTPSSNPSLSYKKVTCTDLSSTTVGVDPASCLAGWTPSMVVTCPKTAAGPYPSATAVQSCTSGYDSGTKLQTACNTTTSTSGVTAANCGPLGTTTPTSSPWITKTCNFVKTTSFTPPAPDAGACKADNGSAAPYETVTCSTKVLSAADGVPANACPNGALGQFVGSAPDYKVVTCSGINLSQVPADCVPNTVSFGPGPDNWVTICSGTTANVPVASCTPGTEPPNSANDWTQTVCSNTHAPNGTQFVQSCKGQIKDVGNGYTQITCSTATTTTNNVSRNACTPAVTNVGSQTVWDPATQTNITCTTALDGPYATAAAVSAPCTSGEGMNPGYYTTCTRPNPGVDNYNDKLVAGCPNGPGPNVDPVSKASTTCRTNVTQDFVASCTQSASVKCATTPHEVQAKSATCVVGEVSPTKPYAKTTACTDTAAVKTDVASCTPGTGPAPDYLQTTCGSDPKTSGVAVASCTQGTSSTGLVTTCTQNNGTGYKYSMVTKTTVTSTPYSNGVPAGPSVVVGPTSTSPVDVDGVCYSTPQTFTAQPALPANCTAWPCEVMTTGTVGSVDSLADVAQYYYRTNLRPSMTANNVPKIGNAPEEDFVTYQHMTTFVVGMGVSGTLDYRSDYRNTSTTTGDFADIRTGKKNWPLWPDPKIDYTPNDPAYPANFNNPKSIDDFWHTAVNGRGAYFSARNPTTVVQGLGSALAGISVRTAAGAGDGASTLEPVAGNNFVYSTSYQTGAWTGDLRGQEVNLTTGALVTPPMWSADALLGSRVQKTCDARDIYLIRSGAAGNVVDFTWNTQKCSAPVGNLVTSLNAAEQLAFGATNVGNLSQYTEMTDGKFNTVDQRNAAAGTGQGYKLVNFLRGQKQHEDFVGNSLDNLFRTRTSVLGDIVGSQPVYVKAPFANYADSGYTAFKQGNAASRTPMVYVGANDGMLHAFYAGQSPTDADRGKEKWAVIPSTVLPNLYKLADNNYKNNHQFYVDGSPVVGDVYDGSNWRTILVAGLNAGGKGYYAMDVTDPNASSPQALWEFKYDALACPSTGSPTAAAGQTADCNLGLSFGKPIITKLKVNNVPTWVVMVTSGYNNVTNASNGGDGGGFLYVLNAVSGSIIYKIATGAGSATDPSGLAQINNFVNDAMVDNTTLRAYGGDLLGNVWRFEFGTSLSAKRLGTAMAPSTNAPQPITVRPELAELKGKPVVFVGTGKLLGSSDITDDSQQSVYGFADPMTSGSPVIANDLRTSLRQMSMTMTGTGAGAVRQTSCSSNCTSSAGWVVDLPRVSGNMGERVNVDMKLVLGTLVVGSNVPKSAPCTVGGHSWFNYFDFESGEAVSTAPMITPNTPSNGRIVSQFLGDSLIGGFNIMRLPPTTGFPEGKFIGQFHLGNDDHLQVDVPVGAQAPTGKRISWREIPR